MGRKPKTPAAGKTPDGPPKEIPKPIVIDSVKRGRKNIVIHWTQGDAAFQLDERANPLPSFYKAFDALTPVVATICHLGANYVKTGLRVVKMDCGEKGGAPTVALHCRKDIDDAAKEFAFKTPERLLEHPAQEGKYTPPLPKSDAELVEAMVEEAKQYVMGNRAQGEISFPDDEDGDDENSDDPNELPFSSANTGQPQAAAAK